MWCASARWLVLFAALFLAGCGFEPLYKQGTPAANLAGQIDVQIQTGRFEFELRDRILDHIGQANSNAAYEMRYKIGIRSSDLVISSQADITRFVLNGTVNYQIYERATGKNVYSNSVRETTAYSATAGTYPTEVARIDANIRLSHAMADRIVTQLALSAQDWLN